MRIIKKKTLKDFSEKHPDIKNQLEAWYREMKTGTFKTPADIKKKYKSADIIANNRAIFNIKGNHYRLIVEFHYNRQIGYIRFIDTHEEYNKINAKEI